MGPAYPFVPPPKNEGKAIGALLLGMLSVTCFGLLAGVPAIILGAAARREIDASQGRLGGRGLAASGIVLGFFGTGLSLVLAVGVLSGVVGSWHIPGEEPRVEAPVPRVPISTGTRSYGSLDVVDLDGDRPLKPQLQEIARGAHAKGRLVVLQTFVRSSKECAEVAASFPDRRMQKALANVTLIRADIEAYEDELRAMRVETESAPWFYMLDAGARPIDAISADEWDANIPENMAPVLGSFVKGTLASRKGTSGLGTDL
jgi:Domain of unknown function (DUF4190)